MDLSDQIFLEAKDALGTIWDVVLVRSGLSKNGTFYTDRVLRDATPLFEGARVFALPDAKHLGDAMAKRDVALLAGWITSPRFVDGDRPDTGYIAAQLNLASGQAQLRQTLVDAWKRGKRDLVGLSIDVEGMARRSAYGARQDAASITKVNSVDIVIEPAAGGSLVRLIEAVSPSGARGQAYSCRAEELFDRFFTARQPMSFRECYIEITGDKRCTGRLEDADPRRLAESIGSATWAQVFGSAVGAAMVREYGNASRFDAWRRVASIAQNVRDFRTQTRVRFGGYGELATVAEGDPYPALTTPADEAVTYAVSKRGGTETLTLEMIKNDDVGAIRRLPKRLADAAKRTLAHFVLDFLRTNANIYDGVALFHASHGNLGAAALSASALAAGRAAMMHQSESGSGEQLMTEPRYLFVPVDLEETAENLFRRGDNNDRTFTEALNVQVVPVWYWTDANDWCLAADPGVLPSIEIAFLDGREEPELFIQDLPSVGSMFTNDQITLKIRHTYGGAVVDFRGLYKSIA